MFKPLALLMTTSFMTTLSWGAAGLDRSASPETPECLSPKNATFRPVTPLVTPVSALSESVATSGKSPLTPCIEVGPRLVLANAVGTAERAKFAQCYVTAVRNHQFTAAGNLVSQLAQQLQWAHSAEAEAAQLTLAELEAIMQQVNQALNLEHEVVTELSELTVNPDSGFTGTSLAVALGELQALALLWQQAGRVVELDPVATSGRVVAACDHRIWRWLRVHKLAEKYVTPANLAWVQEAIIAKICPPAKA